MARSKPKFSVLDVQRALRGTVSAGLTVAKCEIRPDGTISVVTTDGTHLDGPAPESVDSQLTPLDRWRAKRDARRKDAERS